MDPIWLGVESFPGGGILAGGGVISGEEYSGWRRGNFRGGSIHNAGRVCLLAVHCRISFSFFTFVQDRSDLACMCVNIGYLSRKSERALG